MTKLDYGFKIAKRGFNVLDLSQERKNTPSSGIPSHMECGLALPYLYGAKLQVKRYQAAASTLRQNPSGGVIACIHEASTLFEDLCTLSKYLEKCGTTHNLHGLWLNVRNHIRHDIREELGNENEPRKGDRALKLKLNSKLEMSMGFSIDLIKVGETEIEISQIISYLDWADKLITKVMNEAKRKGQISN